MSKFSKLDVNMIMGKLTQRVSAQQYNMVGSKVFPTINTTRKTGDIMSMGLENLRLPKDGGKRAPGTAPKYSDYTMTKKNLYAMTQYCHGYLLPEEDLEDAAELSKLMEGTSALRPFQIAKDFLLDKVSLSKEKLVADIVRDPAQYDASHVDTPAKLWSAADSTPIKDIRIARGIIEDDTHGFESDTLVMGRDVYRTLLVNPEIKSIILFLKLKSEKEIISNLPEILGVKNIYVGNAQIITSEDGVTPEVATRIWEKDCFVFFDNPNGTVETNSKTFGKTFQYPTRNGKSFKQFFDEEIDSWKIKIKDENDIAVVDPLTGFLLDDVIA